MPDYVWAVHDFVPEHEDEIDFCSGDRIEILERDDQYSDGWWQGKNPAGKAGLFPQSYTSDTPPDAPQSARNQSTTGLQTLQETDEAQDDSSVEGGGAKPDSAVMTATMTDVQAAIDQLDNQSEAASFSFASTKEESDDPLSDSDAEHDNDDSWRADARRALAERAMREMERMEQQEAAAAPIRASLPPIDAEISDESDAEDDRDRSHVLDGTPRTTTFPSTVPPPVSRRTRSPTPPPEPVPIAAAAAAAVPIPTPAPIVQSLPPPREPTPEPPRLPVRERTPSPPPVRPSTPARSDRSAPFASSHSREASVLSPPTPNPEASPSARGSILSVSPQPMSMPSPVTMPISAPAPALYNPPSIVALAAAMPLPSSPVPEDQPQQRSSGIRTSGGFAPYSAKASRPASGTTTRTHSYTGAQPERSYTPVERTITERPPNQYPAPSPPQLQPVYQPDLRTSTDIPASLPSPAASSFDARVGPRYSSATTTSSAPRASTTVTSPQSSLFNNPNAGVHPSEWSVDQVVAWLRARGFDESVCDKFTEQEISGDVLLELDATVLKDEIGIVQFGKRMRIANAIQDLQRPPSVVSSENSGSKLQQPQQMGQHPHQSLTQQQHPYQQHLPSQQPQGYGNSRQSNGNGNGTSIGHGTSPLITSMISPESPPHSGDIIYTPNRHIRPESEPGSAIAPQIIQPSGYGLGFSGGHARTDSTASGQPPSVVFDRSESIHRSSNGHSLGVRQPNSLTFSPSDGALNKRAALADQILEDLGEERAKDERAAMSEGETAGGLEARTSKRKNKSSDPPPVQFQFDAPGHRKGKTSVDVPPAKHSPTESNSTGTGSRLSFFGGGGNKPRKPPPRVASADAVAENADPPAAAPSRNLSTRLHFGSTNKRPPSRAESSPTNANTAAVASTQPTTLRKRTMSAGDSNGSARGKINLKPGMSIIDQIGESDYSGWMRKRGERYNTWKLRYFVLKGPHLYYLRSRNETKLKGYINIVGYKVIADENANPGRYGFRIVHETDKPHYFSSEEQMVVREWMKAVMKATIDRDYTRPVISSCNIPTIPLTVAQAMNPAPRPPSPSQRDATQRAMRRENPNQLSSRDARVLMGLPDGTQGPGVPSSPPMDERKRLESFFSVESGSTGGAASPPISPVSPTRPKRRTRTSVDPPAILASAARSTISPEDEELVKWINSHLPNSLHVTDLAQSLATGLVIFRLAEAIKGRAVGVPDSVFPRGPNDDRLEGLFKLFDFLLDNEIRTGNVSINDVRQGRRDKIIQLVKSLKTWEEKRQAIAKSVGVGAVVAGPWAS